VGRGARLILAGLGGLLATAARAQEAPESPRLTIDLAAQGADLPRVRATGLLGGDVFTSALHSGFPVQLHFRLDLYRDATLFDRLERSISWDAVVRLDPIDGHYDLVRTGGSVERLDDLAAVRRALAVPFTVEVHPPQRRGRYYYSATLDVESLSLTELEEVEAWLRGDLEPAVRERGDLGDALGRGARRLLIRFSGLPRLRLETRSETFRQ